MAYDAQYLTILSLMIKEAYAKSYVYCDYVT